MPYNCVVCGDRLNRNKENEEPIVTNVEERRAGGKWEEGVKRVKNDGNKSR